jgi:hypothetical protein
MGTNIEAGAIAYGKGTNNQLDQDNYRDIVIGTLSTTTKDIYWCESKTFDATIPVELTTFTARQKGKHVQLNWNTATEVRNFGFEIERAMVNSQSLISSWTKIGFVEGYGNSNVPHDYTFTDNTLPTNGKYIYRLKQVDTDGSFEYSKQVEVNVEIPNVFALAQNYPNPFNPVTSISYQLAASSHVTLTIYDMLGNEVTTLVNQSQDAGKYTVTFNASKLSSGTYIYRLQAGDYISTKKMILIK